MAALRVAIIMTCFNRKQSTLACLKKLSQQTLARNIEMQVYLTDDGSDGSAQAVLKAFPKTHILQGDGSLYWSGGMRKAWAEAFKHNYDFYLWLNDDTLLYPDALERLLQTHDALERSHGCTIVAGSARDPETGDLTYGGVVRSSRLQPTRFSRVRPADIPVRCDTMNGNCVLVPRTVTEKVGNLSEVFTHGIGDFDYGLRATGAGCSVWVCPGYVGACSHDHPLEGTWRDRSLSRSRRWHKVRQPKGLPPREWGVFVRRHAGPLWPVFWMSPYLRIWLGR